MKSIFYILLLSVVLLTIFSQAHGDTTTTSASTTTAESSSSLSDGAVMSEENPTDENLVIFSLILLLCGAVLVVYVVVRSEFHYLPESVAVVVYGILVGLILRFVKGDVTAKLSTFDPEMFFLFLLPSIIFESGFSLSKTPFFKNIGSILAFAVFGTGISFVFVGVLLYLLGDAGASYPLTLKESMTTGALLSATDPVATLAIFQALNVDQQLYMIVFGESILNDAVALILFRAAGNFSGDVGHSISIFFIVSFGSMFLGIAVALVLSGIFRVLHIHKFPPLETILMVMFSYMSYVLADTLELSGIMSVFFCGIAFNHYGSYSLSPYTTLTSRQLFRTLAFVCETSVFLYIGISLSTIELVVDVRLIFWIIFLNLVGRALHVFPICFILNRFKKTKISPQIQVAVWFAGLRGAIAFSLALDLDTAAAPVIKSATLVFVHFTLFVMGIGTLPLLKILKIQTASSDQSLDNISKAREKSTQEPSSRIKTLTSLDEKYMKVWFRRPVPQLAREAVTLFERLVSNADQQPRLVVASPERKPIFNYDSPNTNTSIPSSPIYDANGRGPQSMFSVPLEINSDNEEEVDPNATLLQKM